MIEITFDNSVKEVSAFGLTQWDKGQKLRILWEDMPESFQVHFTSRGSQEAVVVSAESESGVAEVDIPDALLRNSADIFAWIYLTDGGAGESVRRAVLYVRPRAKPHTNIDDLEPTQQEILEDILRDIKENGTQSDSVPDYVRNQAEKLAVKVAENRDENSVVFMLASDANLKKGDYNSENALKHMSQAMKIIADSCVVDFTAYLGDMTSGGSDKSVDEAKTEIIRVNSALSYAEGKMPTFRLYGGEDNLNKACYRNGTYLDSAMLYNLIGSWNKDAESSANERVRGYFYKDFEDKKLRVICLNTSDTYGKNLTADSDTATVSISQLSWLCERLDLSAKSDSNEWSIILLGHHPLSMVERSLLIEKIFEAYVNGSGINITTTDKEHLVYDFSGKNSAKLLAQFHGHTHNYKVSFLSTKKIPLIAVPNAGFYDNNFYSDSSYTNAENLAYSETVTYNKKINSAEDTAFCVVVADKVTGEIKAFHYGAGIDRTVKGAEVTEDSSGSEDTDNGDQGGGDSSGGEDNNNSQGGSSGDSAAYTNMVPYSITSAGNVYSSTGYLDDNKLLSSGQQSYAEGHVHTGFIPADKNSVIRVAECIFDKGLKTCLLVYDSNFELLWSAILTGYKDASSGVSYTETGIMVFRPAEVTTGNLDSMAYFRVSVIGQGKNLIATVNEDIDGSNESDEIAPPATAYTNVLQYACDRDGEAFANAGYMNNYSLARDGNIRLNSGYTFTGYIEAYNDAVIRFKGLSFDGSEGSCICLYNSNYELIKYIPISKQNDASTGIVVKNSVTKFTPADAEDDFSNLKYFRLSGIGKGANLIITYLEELY